MKRLYPARCQVCSLVEECIEISWPDIITVTVCIPCLGIQRIISDEAENRLGAEEAELKKTFQAKVEDFIEQLQTIITILEPIKDVVPLACQAINHARRTLDKLNPP